MIRLIALAMTFTSTTLVADSIILDDFESGTIEIVKPDAPSIDKKYLWNQYPNDITEGPDYGVATISTEVSYQGNNSLKVVVDSGNVYLQFYPSRVDGWDYMNQFIDGWENDKYYKLSFWMKLPDGINKKGTGRKNVTFGTYIRATTADRNNAESGGAGGHFYHNFDVESTGVWQQVIIDMHPDHERSANGYTEHDYKIYRTEETGYNYFDTMTRFYFEVDGGMENYPATFYFDQFELIDDPYGENFRQIGSLTGAYISEENRFSLNWRRRKDEKGITHTVKYAFSSIHQSGWGQAIDAPSGSITGRNDDYTGMEYVTSAIDMVGRSEIFFAIKPDNNDSFREFKFTLPRLPRPLAPTALEVISN
jgi:hypothetical protein